MADNEVVDEALSLLSVLIGTIMEDEVDTAVSALPFEAGEQGARFESLGRAGRDIVALAEAAHVLLRRSADEAIS